MEAAKYNPPPGYYEVKVDHKGKSIHHTANPVKFTDRKRESFLDVAIKEKEGMPAPGLYKIAGSAMERKGAVISRDKIVDTGLDKHSIKRLPAWQRPATETP